MRRLLVVLTGVALVLAGSGIAAAAVNTIASSTMYFHGDLTQTDLGGGVYAYVGTIFMTDGGIYGGGFDVYGQQDGEAYVQGYYGDGAWNGPSGTDTYVIGYFPGADHDAYPPETDGGPWGTWYDPDCEDWGVYSLELTTDHWYLRYTPTGESPMSGTMNWATMFAAETDLGTQDGGHDGSAAHGGGAQAWDWDCGWGVEVIPLELPGFAVTVTPGGSYDVTLAPAIPEPTSLIIWSTLLGACITVGWRRKRKAA